MTKQSHSSQNFKIIIIEDDEGLNRLISKNLKRLNYQTVSASNGTEGIEKIQGKKNEILLVDYKLPDMDAESFIKRLQKRELTPPFIVITGRGDEKTAVKMMKLGASDYIIKQENLIDILKHRIKKVCNEIDKEYKLQESRKELKESQARYQTFIRNSSEGIYRMEIQPPLDTTLPIKKQIDRIYEDSYLAECNQTFAKMYDADSIDEILNKSLVDLHGGKNDPENRRIIEKFIKSGYRIENDETVEKTEKGDKIWFSNSNIGVLENDKLVRMWGTQLNITERKRTEQKLKEQKESLRTTLNSIGDAVISTDLDGKVVRMNSVAEKLTGWEIEEARDKPLAKIFKIVNSKTGKPAQNPVEKVLHEDKIVGLANHTVLISKNGKKHQIADSGSPIKNEQGDTSGVVLVFRDVTEQHKKDMQLKQSEKNLREYKNRLEGIMQAGNLAWWEINIKTGKVKFNQQKSKMLGYTTEDFTYYQDFLDLIHPDDYEKAMQAMKDHLHGKAEVYKVDYRIKTKSGQYKWFHDIGATTTRDNNGQTINLTGVVVDITERKTMEKELQESEDQLRTLINATPDIICFKDGQGRWLQANQSDLELFSLTDVDYRGKTDAELAAYTDPIYKESFITCELTDERAWKNKGLTRTEETIPQVNGNPKTYDVIKVPIFSDDNERQGLVVLGRDITERKKAQRALEASQKKYESIFNNTGTSTIIIDKDTTISLVNKEFEKLSGFSREEIEGKISWTKFVPKKELQRLKKNHKNRRKDNHEAPNRYEFEFIDKENHPHNILLTIDMIPGTSQSVASLLDITENKKMEENLRQSQAKYKGLFYEAPLGILHYDQDGIITECNDLFVNIIGSSEEALIGFNMVNNLQNENLRQAVISSLENGQGKFEGDYTSITAKKTTPVRVLFKGIKNDQGEISSGIGIIEDITERKKAQEKLKKSEARFRHLVEDLGDAIFVTKIKGEDMGQILEVNKAAEKQTGYTREELLSMNITEDLVAEGPSDHSFKEMNRKLLNGNKVEIVEKKKKKDGTEYWTEVVLTSIEFKDNPAGLSINHDITDRIKAEKEKEKLQQQLMQTQKLESIGTLAGGIAHDFNNILTVIMGLTQMLLSQTEPSDPNYEHLKNIDESAGRAAKLTKKLLLFSRKQDMNFQNLNINETILQLDKMLNRLIGEDVKMEHQLADDIWQIQADEGQIEQVVTNLVVNAKDAMPDGGHLSIRTQNVIIDELKAKTIPDIKPGEYVRISIEDTGHGMPPEIQDKIFDPFFTTKGRAEGTGMGLSVVHGIIKEHEGLIKVYSEPGEGTIFRIYLPRIHKDGEQKIVEEKEKDYEKYKGNGETVLIVEDEEPVLNYLVNILDNYGYEYFSAKNGEEALKLFEENSETIEVLLSDVIMTGMDGVDLADRLTKKKQDLVVILSSGYSSRKVSRTDLNKKDYKFIQKPYDITNLLEILHKAVQPK